MCWSSPHDVALPAVDTPQVDNREVREFETDRLFLRPWQLTDVDFVFDLYSRWEVQRFIGRVPPVMRDKSEAASKLESKVRRGHPVHGSWAVGRSDSGDLIGTILVKPVPASGEVEPPEPSGDVEIGWHFHPDSWGNGDATEAAAVVLDHAFRSGLERVVAVTAPGNLASQRVARGSA